MTKDNLYRVKRLFFDKQRVINAVDSGLRSALSKFGGYVRKTAKSLIKPVPKKDRIRWITKNGHRIPIPKTSAPGMPPYSRTGLLKRFIFYSWDNSSKSVVIGPEKLPIKGQVPHALEYGGATYAPEYDRDVNGRMISRERRVTIKPRPFMHPALEMSKPQLPPLIKDSVK